MTRPAAAPGAGGPVSRSVGASVSHLSGAAGAARSHHDPLNTDLRQIPGGLLPRRWQPLLKLWTVCVVAAAIVHGVHDGHPSVIVLTVCAVTDLCISAVHRRHRRPLHRQLQPIGLAANSQPAAAQAAQ